MPLAVMNRNVCARCGKPVYHAERKTSLGRNWHPNCLRCTRCGRVLTPGQHAEHKGNPYCQTPCYQVLFGPALLGYGANIASPANFAKKEEPAEFAESDNMYKCEIFSKSHQSVPPNPRKRFSSPPVLYHDFTAADSVSSPSFGSPPMQEVPAYVHDILKKVEVFNSFIEGKNHHQMTVEQLPNGEVRVQGPLRIYWGLSRPIQLRHCDDVPALPIAKWRHSLYISPNSPVEQQNGNNIHNKLMSPKDVGHLPFKPLDDSALLSPGKPDDVVMRRPHIRKFNTVAYRNDAPSKWKRASINGHIFNFDTSVFTPVLGSCTSVMADSTMTSPVVIQTLLEKFKVENSPSEYVLSVVMENEERLLGNEDKPLLERLELGADDQGAKIFLKERQMAPAVTSPDAAIQLPIVEEEEETLPDEVEQLLILPLAVLMGILKKYHKDEEREIRRVKVRYEHVQRKILQRMEEMKSA